MLQIEQHLGVGFVKKQLLEYTGQLARKHKIKLKRLTPSEKWSKWSRLMNCMFQYY